MENTGKIIRSKKNGKSRYTPVSNSVIQDKTLTLDERMTLIYLLSLPEDWIVYKTEIWKRMNVGRDRFYKIWKVLENRGYIQSEKQTNTLGQIKGYNHIIFEEPILLPESQETGNQFTETQDTETQDTETQEVNKVLRKQSNKKQSNKLESKLVSNINTSTINTGQKIDSDFYKRYRNEIELLIDNSDMTIQEAIQAHKECLTLDVFQNI